MSGHRDSMDRGLFTFVSGMVLALCAISTNAESLHSELVNKAKANELSAADYRQAAVAAADWLRSVALVSEHGITWPPDPLEPSYLTTNLYHGTPGVVLFFLELAKNTGNADYLLEARSGADYLLNSLRGNIGTDDENLDYHGFYAGLAGVGFALHETYVATGDKRYRAGVQEVLDRLRQDAQRVGDGIAWTGGTDIVIGAAGTGLFLIYAANALDDQESLDLAVSAGRRLVELADRQSIGLSWKMSADSDYLMPNFSHGTAGVAYFLATLHEATGEPAFLDAAVAGAERLLSLAKTDGDVCLVFHHTDGGEGRHYLSWCHGPAGTARLFYKLAQITGDENWLDWTLRAARGITSSGIPEIETPGFWNNVSQCCGSAGVAEFFLGLYQATGDTRHLAFARRMAVDLLARASDGQPGLKWIQAEHRVKPDLLIAQTGLMQGASGIGLMFLRLASAIEGSESTRIALPDWPFETSTASR